MADETLALALGAVARKERTVAELAEWLRERDVEEAEIERVVGFLIETGTLDDERFARLYAEDKRDLAGWGTDRIRQALRERGLSGQEVEAVLAEEGFDDELARAVELLHRRGHDLSDDRGRNRALGLLARRGYSSEIAYEAIRVAAAA